MAVPLTGAEVEQDAARVLIVDDEPRNLDVLEVMLDGVECTLVRANSAEEALLCVVRHDFAAFVLDINMPGMNGLELARLIKQRKRSAHVPILLLTAHLVDDADVLRGYGVGAVDFLSKPLNAEILRHKIGALVSAFRNARMLAQLNDALQREASERQKAQLALEEVNADLERRVHERTEALSRAHRDVRANEERMRMALEVAHIAAWEWYVADGLVRWSTDPEPLFGFPAGALGDSRRLMNVVHPEDRDRVAAALADSLTTGVFEAEYRALHPDGSLLWITERGRLLSDADGERMVGITRDVTIDRERMREREQLLKREREARDEAERQSRLKDEFLATLSHELRTPMNAILGWLQILQSGKPVRDLASALSVIQRNAQIQSRLIEDLLDMNRLLSGNMPLELTNVAMNPLVQSAVQGLLPLAGTKMVQVTASVDAADAVVTGDSSRLHQVLWNLLHNAIKFTPSGGGVRIAVERRDASVVVHVADTGQGISPDFLPHVFERFRQEDASSTRETFGLGLGLSIVKQLVELHGGSVRAASPGVGGGATFTVEIPAARRSLPTLDDERRVGSGLGAPETAR